MIASLVGTVTERNTSLIVLEVAGVGYEVQLTLPDLSVVNVGQTLKLYVHQVIREDGHFIFGFIRREQREWFRLLIKVNGLGPKLAMAVISVMRPAELMECVYSDNYKLLTKIPGVGNKVAQRLVVELKGKIKNCGGELVSDADLMVSGAEQALLNAFSQTSGNTSITEAISALINLGYKPQQAQQVVGKIKDANTKSCEELIREALKLKMPRNSHVL